MPIDWLNRRQLLRIWDPRVPRPSAKHAPSPSSHPRNKPKRGRTATRVANVPAGTFERQVQDHRPAKTSADTDSGFAVPSRKRASDQSSNFAEPFVPSAV